MVGVGSRLGSMWGDVRGTREDACTGCVRGSGGWGARLLGAAAGRGPRGRQCVARTECAMSPDRGVDD